MLLDENLDCRLRNHLGAYEAFKTGYMGWDGMKNGNLLQAAEIGGFDVLLTGDRSLYYQQSLRNRRLAVIVLSCVEWRILKKNLPQIIDAIARAHPGSFQAINCGVFTRR